MLGGFSRHGVYEKYHYQRFIPILRVRCLTCRKTHALIPSFSVPGTSIGMKEVESFIFKRAGGGQLVSEVTSVHHSAGRILTPIEPLVAEDQFRWIIRADGGLELRYLNGLITTLTPVQ